MGGEASTIADLGVGPDNAERYRKTAAGPEGSSRISDFECLGFINFCQG